MFEMKVFIQHIPILLESYELGKREREKEFNITNDQLVFKILP